MLDISASCELLDHMKHGETIGYLGTCYPAICCYMLLHPATILQ